MARKDCAVLHYDNDLGNRQTLLDVVDAFCRRAGGDEQGVGRIRLALDELFTNIVSYAYDDDKPHRITVELDRSSSGIVTITLIDDGRAFNPLDRPPPDLDADIEDREIGGLGIHLVKTFTDSCEYSRNGDLNRLTITKGFGRARPGQGKEGAAR